MLRENVSTIAMITCIFLFVQRTGIQKKTHFSPIFALSITQTVWGVKILLIWEVSMFFFCFLSTKYHNLFLGLVVTQIQNCIKPSEPCFPGCPQLYNPVCGLNELGVNTFTNYCTFAYAMCKQHFTESRWTFVRTGDCNIKPT